MEEHSKTHQHSFLAFETIPPHLASHVSEIIVKPNIGFSWKNRVGLRLLSMTLVVALVGATGWMVYDYLSADARIENSEAQIAKLSLSAILANGDLTTYARHAAAPLFAEHCAGCHGEKGEGHQTEQGLFAPVLNDNDWMFEGKIDNIYAAIANGSQSLMPAFRRKLSERQLDSVAKYVKALSEGQGEKEAEGERVFESSGCRDCHGEDATGSKSLGAVNLTDSVWRFEGTLEGIRRTIAYGVNSGDSKDRTSSMPNFTESGKLSKTDMKKLAIYVYKLSSSDDRK